MWVSHLPTWIEFRWRKPTTKPSLQKMFLSVKTVIFLFRLITLEENLHLPDLTCKFGRGGGWHPRRIMGVAVARGNVTVLSSVIMVIEKKIPINKEKKPQHVFINRKSVPKRYLIDDFVIWKYGSWNILATMYIVLLFILLVHVHVMHCDC